MIRNPHDLNEPHVCYGVLEFGADAVFTTDIPDDLSIDRADDWERIAYYAAASYYANQGGAVDEPLTITLHKTVDGPEVARFKLPAFMPSAKCEPMARLQAAEEFLSRSIPRLRKSFSGAHLADQIEKFLAEG